MNKRYRFLLKLLFLVSLACIVQGIEEDMDEFPFPPEALSQTELLREQRALEGRRESYHRNLYSASQKQQQQDELLSSSTSAPMSPPPLSRYHHHHSPPHARPHGSPSTPNTSNQPPSRLNRPRLNLHGLSHTASRTPSSEYFAPLMTPPSQVLKCPLCPSLMTGDCLNQKIIGLQQHLNSHLT